MAGGAQAGGGGSRSHARGHSGRLNWNLNAGHCCPQNSQESALPWGLDQAWTGAAANQADQPLLSCRQYPSPFLQAALLDPSIPLYLSLTDKDS